MATVSEFVATSRAAGLSYADLLESVKYALISGISADGRMVTAVNSRGTAISMNIEAARSLLYTLHLLMLGERGGIQPMSGEFVSG